MPGVHCLQFASGGFFLENGGRIQRSVEKRLDEVQVPPRVTHVNVVLAETALQLSRAFIRIDGFELQHKVGRFHLGIGLLAAPRAYSHKRECTLDAGGRRERSFDSVLRAQRTRD